MERGTSRERDAGRERWAELERRRRETSRMVRGLFLLLSGLLLLGLAMAKAVCFTTMGGGVIACTPVTQAPVPAVVALLGLVSLVVGSWTCWTVARS